MLAAMWVSNGIELAGLVVLGWAQVRHRRADAERFADVHRRLNGGSERPES
jgi:hypothetical protein